MTTIRHILAGKPDIYSIDPDATALDALRLMEQKNIGALLVMKGGALSGIFSERDYARRMILHGRSSKETPVREVMSGDVHYVFADDSIEEAAIRMGHLQVRRLPVLNRDKRLIGIISLGDVSRSDGATEESGAALKEITQPGGPHAQV